MKSPAYSGVETSIDKKKYSHGLLPREDVRLVLRENGDFLLRVSEPKSGESRSYVVSVLVDKNTEGSSSMRHLVIQSANNKFWINKTSFDSIQQLIAYYLSSAGRAAEPHIRLIKPINRQSWELEHDWITIQKRLGEGAFGEVSMGLFKYQNKGNGILVAVKQAKLDKMGKEQIKEFMGEARYLRSFDHPNIVKFYGVAVIQEPLYMVMELVADGALDSYLKKNPHISIEVRNEMILQAALGLEYIHAKSVIHRDIAARNCLYGDKKVKISDFGLSRSGFVYQMSVPKKLPIRWLAIETLISMLYTPKSDVWAYGIMCWEIYNSAQEPYPGLTVVEVNQKVREGYRMTVPSDLHGEIQRMMKNCWSEDPIERMPMSAIVGLLQRVTRASLKLPSPSGREMRTHAVSPIVRSPSGRRGVSPRKALTPR